MVLTSALEAAAAACALLLADDILPEVGEDDDADLVSGAALEALPAVRIGDKGATSAFCDFD